MSLLLERHEALVNAKNELGVTALMIASSEAHPSCISLLLDRGATINEKSDGGKTAVMVMIDLKLLFKVSYYFIHFPYILLSVRSAVWRSRLCCDATYKRS